MVSMESRIPYFQTRPHSNSTYLIIQQMPIYTFLILYFYSLRDPKMATESKLKSSKSPPSKTGERLPHQKPEKTLFTNCKYIFEQLCLICSLDLWLKLMLCKQMRRILFLTPLRYLSGFFF